jgi:hypothetical protein
MSMNTIRQPLRCRLWLRVKICSRVLLQGIADRSEYRYNDSIHISVSVTCLFRISYTNKLQRYIDSEYESKINKPVKVNSHMPCRAHAVPLPCRAALIHTCHAAPLPFPDSAVSFVKVDVVAGNIRTAIPTV